MSLTQKLGKLAVFVQALIRGQALETEYARKNEKDEDDKLKDDDHTPLG